MSQLTLPHSGLHQLSYRYLLRPAVLWSTLRALRARQIADGALMSPGGRLESTGVKSKDISVSALGLG